MLIHPSQAIRRVAIGEVGKLQIFRRWLKHRSHRDHRRVCRGGPCNSAGIRKAGRFYRPDRPRRHSAGSCTPRSRKAVVVRSYSHWTLPTTTTFKQPQSRWSRNSAQLTSGSTMRWSPYSHPRAKWKRTNSGESPEVTYLGVGVTALLCGIASYGSSEPRNDCAGGIGSRLPKHSSTVGILCRETRSRGIYRFVEVGAHSRWNRYSPDDGSVARAEHTPIRLGKEPSATTTAARAANLSTRSRGARDRVGRTPSPPRGHGRRAHGESYPGKQDDSWIAGPVPGLVWV